MKDSLDFVSYYRIALWLTGRLEPRIRGCEGPSYYPQDMQLPEEEQQLLWNHFYASKGDNACGN
jgi:hypothetical protein